MKKNSFLIRFIDIGLILLFGFVIISDITIRSQIELPGHEDSASGETENILLFLEIQEANQYKITEVETQLTYEEINGLSELEGLLLAIKEEKMADNFNISAVIHPQEDATMQQLVDVLDICDRIGISKNINIPS
ncbi:MAG: biopolymer transporter ExbD [Balneolales bacterium]